LITTEIRTFFRKHFGIHVRVRIDSPLIEVWPDSCHGNAVDAGSLCAFPNEVGSKFMRIVYKGHPTLEGQTWGRNVSPTYLAFSLEQWKEFVAHPDFQDGRTARIEVLFHIVTLTSRTWGEKHYYIGEATWSLVQELAKRMRHTENGIRAIIRTVEAKDEREFWYKCGLRGLNVQPPALFALAYNQGKKAYKSR
jgi:hypothetical protein